MWNDDNDLILNLQDDVDNVDAKAPYCCPICGSLTGHGFYYKNKENEIGSSWLWCSNCKNFSHLRSVVPSWWVNLNGIHFYKLEGEPNYLEENSKLIDDWSNSLKKEESNK